MTAPTPSSDASRLDAALRRVHRAVLGTLACCAAIVAVSGGETAMPDEMDRGYSLAALGLAGGAILLRRSAIGPGVTPRFFVYGSLLGLLCAGGLGVLGVIVAYARAQLTVGLLYTLAGVLLSLRPPPQLSKAGDA